MFVLISKIHARRIYYRPIQSIQRKLDRPELIKFRCNFTTELFKKPRNFVWTILNGLSMSPLFEFCNERKIESGTSELKLDFLCGGPITVKEKADKAEIYVGWMRTKKGMWKATREEPRQLSRISQWNWIFIGFKRNQSGLERTLDCSALSLSQFTSHILNRTMIVTDLKLFVEFMHFLPNLNSYFIWFCYEISGTPITVVQNLENNQKYCCRLFVSNVNIKRIFMKIKRNNIWHFHKKIKWLNLWFLGI